VNSGLQRVSRAVIPRVNKVGKCVVQKSACTVAFPEVTFRSAQKIRPETRKTGYNTFIFIQPKALYTLSREQKGFLKKSDF